jgi:hypothetical protein
MSTQYFANYKHGKVSINSYRFPDAQVTDIDDVIKSNEMQSEEVLVASIDTEEDLQAVKALIY